MSEPTHKNCVSSSCLRYCSRTPTRSILKQCLDNKPLHFKQAEPDSTDPGTLWCPFLF